MEQLTVNAYARSKKLFSLRYEVFGENLLDALIDRLARRDNTVARVKEGNDLYPDLAKIKEEYSCYVVISIFKEDAILCAFYDNDAFIGVYGLEYVIKNWHTGEVIPLMDDKNIKHYGMLSDLTDDELTNLLEVIENSITFVFFGTKLDIYEY